MKYILLLMVAIVGSTYEFSLPDGNQLMMNSSFNKDVFTISMSSTAVRDSQFNLFSDALSKGPGQHQFMQSKEGFMITPPVDEKIIMFNDFDGKQYWFAIKHPMKQDIKNHSTHSHFVSITISQDLTSYDFLLPAFNMPFSFLAKDSLYKCESVLFSVQSDENIIDISLFQIHDPENSYKLEGKWDWGWRKSDRGYNFGRSTKTKSDDEILIKLFNGKQCSFAVNELQQHRSQSLPFSEYYSFKDVWEWAPSIPSRKTQAKVQQL